MIHVSTTRSVGAALLVLLLAACAHPVKIAPQLYLQEGEARSTIPVGLQVTQAQRELKVTTPGGGGDKITYAPYADLESGLYATLASVFEKVYVVPEAGRDEFVSQKAIRFVFTPTFVTNSSSTNFMLWNPTDFTLKLDCAALDAAGGVVWNETFTAHGKAKAGGSITESPAGQEAARSVFEQLQKALLEAPIFRS